MTTKIVLSVFMAGVAAAAGAQTAAPAKDPDLIGLSTPSVLDKGKSLASLQVNSFKASDTLTRFGASYAYGLGNNWQAKIGATFSPFDSFDLGGGNSIRYGGSAGEFLVKYMMPGMIETSLELGVGYADTPAQERLVQTLASLSAGYTVSNGVRVYVNPKLVTILDNNLAAISFGAVIDVSPGISLFGDWTPYISGNNT